MKKVGLSFLAFGAVVALSSCSVFSRHVWSWANSTINDTINYCLLIGQIDHNDSMYRTRGVRMALDTRPKGPDGKYNELANYNLETPKIGNVTLAGNIDGSVPSKDFKTVEIEGNEQKSLAGATWDPITANGSASTWISKHGSEITTFVSNNDGMAEGASMACNWYKDMPIFGYDANKTTLRLIRSGKIMGTMDSNAMGQCLAAAMIIRNIHDNTKTYHEKNYNPCSNGFGTWKTPKQPEPKENKHYGIISSPVTFEQCDDENVIADNPTGNHAILLDNSAIINFDDVSGDLKETEITRVDDYFKGDSDEIISEKERVADKEKRVHTYEGDKRDNRIKLWQCYYSNSDVYFTGNMDPFFKIFYDMFNIDMTEFRGDGTEESKITDALTTYLSGSTPDAFMFNIVKPSNANDYIQVLRKNIRMPDGTKMPENGFDKWEDRSDIPVIFWNRQPTGTDGQVSQEVMNNKYFKYTYYIGFGARQGGELQGRMVKAWLNKAYVDNYKK